MKKGLLLFFLSIMLSVCWADDSAPLKENFYEKRVNEQRRQIEFILTFIVMYCSSSFSDENDLKSCYKVNTGFSDQQLTELKLIGKTN